MDIQKCARLSMLTAIAIILNIVESFIPFFYIPGIKIGLANVIIVSVLYLYGVKEAFYVSILRIIVVGLLRTGLFSTTFLFSLSGAILSLSMMSIIKKTNLFSIVGISMIGSIFHSIGQLCMAFIVLKNNTIYIYLPTMLILSIITGIFIGFISKEIVKLLKKIWDIKLSMLLFIIGGWIWKN